MQIALWGGLFVLLGEFEELYAAIYHSAVNFTSLGYGDVVMKQEWKLLGPLEAANGVLMMSMTAAALTAILQSTFDRRPTRSSRGNIDVAIPANESLAHRRARRGRQALSA